MAMAKMIRWTVSDLFCLRPNSRPHMWHDRVRLQLAKHWGREPVRIISWGKQRPQQHWTFLVEWVFFFRICLKKGFVERLMEISKKWIPIRRQNHQRVSALPRFGYRFAVHLWFPQWLLHTLPKLQRSCCMPSGRFHMHLEWFPSPWQFWLKKWEMLFHVWFILKFYSQLEIGFNDLLHYDSWISTFKLGIRYTVYRGIRYMRHVTSVMSQSAPTAVMSTDQDTFNRLYLRKSKMNVASIILDEETSFLKRLVSWQQWSVIVMLQKY